jgi:hypothetical protein
MVVEGSRVQVQRFTNQRWNFDIIVLRELHLGKKVVASDKY